MIIKKIKMQNFKGIEAKEYSFAEDTNKLYSKRGIGKTTIFDAYKYVLDFKGIDFEPRKDNTRIGSKENPVITSVELELTYNSRLYSLKKENKQKWSDDGYIGTTSTFWFDGIKCKTSNEYHTELEKLFNIDFSLIPVVADIFYFNSDTSSWDKTNRKDLFDSIFEIDNAQINKFLESSPALCDFIEKGRTEEQINNYINENKADIKKQLIETDVLLKSKQSELDELNKIDFDSLAKEKSEIELEIKNLENSMISQNKNIENLRNEYVKLNNIKSDLCSAICIESNKLNSDKIKNESEINKFNCKKSSIIKEIDDIKKEISNLNENIDNINSKLNVEKHICQYCGQVMPQNIIDVANKKLYENLNDIVEKKMTLIQLLKNTEKSLNEIDSQLFLLGLTKDELENTKIDKSNYEDCLKQIDEVSAKIKEIETSDFVENTNNTLNSLKNRLMILENTLYKRSYINKISSEIECFKAFKKDLAKNEQSTLILQDDFFEYKKLKADAISKAIDEKIGNNISFSFLQEQSVKATKNVKLGCECSLNGILYSSISTGEKIYVNLKINKILQEHFKTSFPLFIDNFQDFNDSVDTNNQVIAFVTIEKDKQLFNNIIEVK